MGGAGPGPSQKAGRLSGPLHGWNGHGRSLVPSTGGASTPEFPPTGPTVRGARSGPSQKADRARPGTPTVVTKPDIRELCVFGGGGRRWRGRLFSGSQHGGNVAWRKSDALLQTREEEEEERGEKRRREEKSVAWRRSAALLQAKEEEEDDRGEKRVVCAWRGRAAVARAEVS